MLCIQNLEENCIAFFNMYSPTCSRIINISLNQAIGLVHFDRFNLEHDFTHLHIYHCIELHAHSAVKRDWASAAQSASSGTVNNESFCAEAAMTIEAVEGRADARIAEWNRPFYFILKIEKLEVRDVAQAKVQWQTCRRRRWVKSWACRWRKRRTSNGSNWNWLRLRSWKCHDMKVNKVVNNWKVEAERINIDYDRTSFQNWTKSMAFKVLSTQPQSTEKLNLYLSMNTRWERAACTNRSLIRKYIYNSVIKVLIRKFDWSIKLANELRDMQEPLSTLLNILGLNF